MVLSLKMSLKEKIPGTVQIDRIFMILKVKLTLVVHLSLSLG